MMAMYKLLVYYKIVIHVQLTIHLSCHLFETVQLAKDDLVTRVDELNSAVDDLTAKITSEKEASQQAA